MLLHLEIAQRLLYFRVECTIITVQVSNHIHNYIKSILLCRSSVTSSVIVVCVRI